MTSRFVLPFADVGSGIVPSDGAQLFFSPSGVDFDTQQKDTYSDEAATTPNPNPVIADSDGVFPDIWISGEYQVVLKDKNNVQIWEADPVTELLTFVAGSFLTSVSDIAALKALTGLTDGQVVNVQYHTSVSAGGGGFFRWNAASTETDDNGRYIQLLAGGSGRFERLLDGPLRPRMYGMIGDNVVDDTIAIQSCYDASDGDIAGNPGHFEWDSGTPRTTATITFGKRVKVTGPSKGACIVKPVGTFVGMETTFGNQEVGGFRLDCTNLTGTGMELTSDLSTGGTSANLQLRDVGVIQGSTHGIHVRSGDIGSMENITVNNCAGDGILVEGKSGPVASASCNSWSLKGSIDTLSNGGNGLNIIDNGGSASNNWYGHITSQNNGAANLRIETLNHEISCYLENSTGVDLDLTPTAQGNFIKVLNTDTIANINNNATNNNNIIWAPIQGFIAIPSIGNTPPVDTAVGGRDVTITGGATASGATGQTAGKALILGGAAAGTNCNGGDVFLKGREGSGTGSQGNVDIASGLVLSKAADTVNDTAALSLETPISNLVTTGAATPTLANGAEGQIKIIRMQTYVSGNVDVDPDGVLHGGTVVRFTGDEQAAILIYTGGGWLPIGLNGATVA